jgi:hypothetical protein
MLFKNDLLTNILDELQNGISFLKKEELPEAESSFRNALSLSKKIDIDDLEISDAHIDAIMKNKEYTDRKDAEKYLLYQTRDFALRQIIGGFLALVIMSIIEQLNVVADQENKEA